MAIVRLPCMKIALGLEYCGTKFFGWQRQNKLRSVQACVEEALSRVANHSVRVTCAGRTDTGVHAVNQVVHFETHSYRDAHSWVLGTNVNLPPDVSVVWAKSVAEDFHARFSALLRTYKYYVLNRNSRPGINAGLVTWEYRRLDIGRMQDAAIHLIGRHDFTSYRSVACQAKNPVRTVEKLELAESDGVIVFTITANAFLHHMVRNIVGVLIRIGSGQRDPGWAREVLLAKDRTAGDVTVAPDGLYLHHVDYPDTYELPRPAPSYIRF